MALLRIILVLMVTVVGFYTLMVVIAHGWGLISVFVDDILAINWSGQFNLDFMSYLLLSAFWVAWRHRFSAAGLGLALIASVAGILFFAPYLLVSSFRVQGDIKALLLGEQLNH